MDGIAGKESFLNLLNSIIACAVATHSPVLFELQQIRNKAYYDKQFSYSEYEDIIIQLHKQIPCSHN